VIVSGAWPAGNQKPLSDQVRTLWFWVPARRVQTLKGTAGKSAGETKKKNSGDAQQNRFAGLDANWGKGLFQPG